MTVRIAVLTSGGAPGLETLLADPARGPIYDLTAVVSAGRHFEGRERLASHGVALIEEPIAAWHRHRGLSPRNLLHREQYDAELLQMVRDADFLFLDDYRYLVTPVLLDAFRGRIVVLHDGDLTAMTRGNRAYASLHAVRNAVLSGEPFTRGSAFVATEEPGQGPLLLLGPPYPVSELAVAAVGRADLGDVDLYARLHRRWMVADSYGTLLRKAAELVSLGTMHVAHDTVWVDGVPGPCRLGDAPSTCWTSSNPPRRGIPSSCPFIQTEVHS